MEFKEVLESRHSVRYFKPNPVPVDVLREIVAGAARAPSTVNAQDWRVWIATGAALEEIRAGFLERNLAGAKPAPEMPGTASFTGWSRAARARMAAFSKSREEAGLAAVKVESQNVLFHAPAVAYLTLPKGVNSWAILDLGGFEQTMLLVAASLGVGSVPAYNLVTYPDIVRRVVGIPESEAVAIGVALGYPEDHPLNVFRSTRAPLEDFLVIKG